MKMDAVLLAGGSLHPDEPLYNESIDGYRCLIDIHGKPMAQWVMDALAASENVGDLYIMGLPEKYGLHAAKPTHYLQETGGIFENIRAGVQQARQDHPERGKVLISSADIPALRTESVDWLVKQVAADTSAQLYYTVVCQPVMEARFPEANRSFVRFKDVAVCGGDLNVVDASLFSSEQALWNQLITARKNPLRQVGMLGMVNLFLIGCRLITLEAAVRRVSKKLAINGRALLTPYPEIAMDADKPHQLNMLRRHLAVGL